LTGPLAWTAATNFLMGGEALWFAVLLLRRPMDPGSAAWYWARAMLLLGVAAVLGGIDHGYFEARGLPRYAIQHGNWLVLGVMTYCVLMAAAAQFFPRRRLGAVRTAGLVQLAVYAAAVLAIDDYLVVELDYGPVILLWLCLHVAGLRSGTGSGLMAAGTAILFVATAIQVSGYDGFSPLDHNGLYHVVSMFGIAALYAGAPRLSAVRAATAPAPALP
jgi:hypothetical protein